MLHRQKILKLTVEVVMLPFSVVMERSFSIKKIYVKYIQYYIILTSLHLSGICTISSSRIVPLLISSTFNHMRLIAILHITSYLYR